MNKVTKERVAEKVTKAISDERLLLREAGVYLGVKSTNLSMIKKDIYYDYVSKAAWDILHEWVDSGLTIRGWGLKKRRIEPDCMVPDIEPEKEDVSSKDNIYADLAKVTYFPPDEPNKPERPKQLATKKVKVIMQKDSDNEPQCLDIILNIKVNLLIE